MNDLYKELPYGATLVDQDELSQLVLEHIRTLPELNEFEQKNISNAIIWLNRNRKNEFLSISFILKLHKKMFEDVWLWAGKFRVSNKNIGCEWHQVSLELKKMLENIQYWIENRTYEIEEIAVRLHHKLVFIHPFSNGNGRHARLYCDTFMKIHGQKPFSWGQMSFSTQSTRKDYIKALRKADNKDFSCLIKFVRS